jgi:hypothetical protein
VGSLPGQSDCHTIVTQKRGGARTDYVLYPHLISHTSFWSEHWSLFGIRYALLSQYLNGHSDVVAGVVAGSAHLVGKVGRSDVWHVRVCVEMWPASVGVLKHC